MRWESSIGERKLMPDWLTPPVVLSSLLALSGILVGVIQSRRQRKFKALAYQVSPIFPLLSVSESIGGSVKILYEDQPVEGLEGVTVRIQNTGREPIEKGDYERPVTVVFGEGAQILKAEIAEEKPDEIEAAITVNDSSVQLTPTLLNPEDSVTISVLLTQFEKDKPDVDGRIVGVRRIEERAGDPAANYWWRDRRVLWTVILVLALWSLILWNVMVDESGNLQEIGLWQWVGLLIFPVMLSAGAALVTTSWAARR